MIFLSHLVGSFAQPAAENPTVAMIEAAFRHHGLNWRYINCEVAPADLGAAVAGARAMGWKGFNCSLPHKVAVVGHLDRLSRSAELIGAVNTVVRQDDALVGENTDGVGFLRALSETIDPRGRSVLLFGAGGAARAIAVELALAGAASIRIVNRSPGRGEALSRHVTEATGTPSTFHSWSAGFEIPRDADIVVNATSIGLFPDSDARLDVAMDQMVPSQVVADVIPNPPATQFLKEAGQKGCTTIDGLGMLVQQGVRAVELWTGVTPDSGVMHDRLSEVLFEPAGEFWRA